MNTIPRIDPSLLYPGVMIDIDDLGREEAITEEFRFTFDSFFRDHPNIHPSVIVNHLVRNGPNNYEIVPFMPKDDGSIYEEDELRKLGLIVDTRHVVKTKGDSFVFFMGSEQPLIYDRLYDEGVGQTNWLASGAQLSEHYTPIDGSKQLRPNHSYVSMNNLGNYVMDHLVRHYNRPWVYLNVTYIVQKLINSKTIHHFANPLLLVRKEKGLVDQVVPFIYLDLNQKRFKRWLARNHTIFFQSAVEVQALEDQIDQEMRDQEAADRLKNVASEQADEAPIEDEDDTLDPLAEPALDGFDLLVGQFEEKGDEPEPYLPDPDAPAEV